MNRSASALHIPFLGLGLLSPRGANRSRLLLLAIALLSPGLAFSQITVIPPSLPHGVVDSTYGFTLTKDGYILPPGGQQFTASGGVSPYTFSLASGSLPPGMLLTGAGFLIGPPTFTGSFTFNVIATDQKGATGQGSFTIVVDPTFLDVPQNGTVGATFNDTFTCFSNTGAKITYHVGGPLPNGVTFDGQGHYMGIPTASGTYTNTFQCTADFTLTVTEPLVIAPQPVTTLPSGPAGIAYTYSGTFTGKQPFSFTITAGSLPPGLSLNASTGTISGTPTTPGVYSFDLRFTNATPTDTTTTTVSTVTNILTINAPATTSPPSLSLTGFSGGSSTSAPFGLLSGTISEAFTVSASTTDGKAWLSATPITTTTPGTVQVTANPANLASGAYTGTVTINVPGANPPTVTEPVTFTVQPAAPAGLAALPAGLNFAMAQGVASSTQILTVSNTGSGSVALNVSATSDGNWLAVSAGGTAAANAPLAVSVSALPFSMANGTYSGTVTVTGPGLSLNVPATLVLSAGPQIYLSPDGFGFKSKVGSTTALTQTLTISNGGGGDVLHITDAKANTTDGAPWLTLRTLGLFDGAAQVAVTADPSGLKSGTYFGVISITAANAPNNPGQADVVFNVPSSSDSSVTADPFGFAFLGSGSQTVSVRAPDQGDNDDIEITLTDDYGKGPHFFTHSPPGGDLIGQHSLNFTITASTTGLAQGIYQGVINVSHSGVNLQRLTVGLVVPRTASTAPADAAAAACVPTQLAPIVTRPGQNFSVSAGWPTPISVLVLDDCGGLNAAGSVAITFSNGDPPLLLRQQPDASWTGTWVGGTPSANVVLTVAATSVTPPLTGTTLIAGTVLANPGQPAVSSGAVLNGASFVLQGPLAPGSFVSLFGSNLADSTLSAPSVPLQNVLAGASLTIAGVPAPVFFSSSGQVNAIIPYGIPVNAAQEVVASRDNLVAVPQRVAFAAAAPGIFMYGKNQGIIVNTSNAFANSTNPVHVGDFIVIYCTGLGEVSPPVPAGTVTPVNVTQYSTTVNPVTLSIGGINAPVVFAGLTPGSTGLYQVNAAIPAGVVPGDSVPVVLTAAHQSSAPVVISVR
jgi:large repetitive protein